MRPPRKNGGKREKISKIIQPFEDIFVTLRLNNFKVMKNLIVAREKEKAELERLMKAVR